MACAVNRPSPTAQTRVLSEASPCGFRGGKSGNGTGFPLGTTILPSSKSFHHYHTTDSILKNINISRWAEIQWTYFLQIQI